MAKRITKRNPVAKETHLWRVGITYFKRSGMFGTPYKVATKLLITAKCDPREYAQIDGVPAAATRYLNRAKTKYERPLIISIEHGGIIDI